MLFEKTFGTNHLRKCESLRFCGAVQIKSKKVDIENVEYVLLPSKNLIISGYTTYFHT